MKKRKYAVAAGHQATAEAAIDILRDGGNAVDAAIAAYWAACTAEPCMASAGAGGFAMVHPAGKAAVLVDFFCQTPGQVPNPHVPFEPIEVDFGESQELFYIRTGSIAVPGAVAGMFHLLNRYGSRPMSVLAQPGTHLARQGLPLNGFQAYDLFLLKDFVGDSEIGRRRFYQEGRIKQAGEVVALPDWADYLEDLSRQDARCFYQGEAGQRMVRDHQGHLALSDLNHYQVIERNPLQVDFQGHRIWTNPHPSIGGLLLGILLAEMNGWPNTDLGDPVAFQVRWEALCARLRQDGFRKQTLQDLAARLFPDGDMPPQAWSGTSHLSIVDHWGNAIALTFSIGEGSGYFIPGTDIHLNNMLGEPALLPDGPFTWQPDVRLSSMMSPTILASADLSSWTALGSGGAGRIPFMLAQVIHRLVSEGMHVLDAVRAPRSHRDDLHFHLEPGFPEQIYTQGYSLPVQRWKEPSLFYGGVHAVRWQGSEMEACGDFRREGVGILA